MDRGQFISAVGHVGVILWVVLGDWLFTARDLPEVEVSEVSLMTEAEFAALVSAAPKTPDPQTAEEPPATEPAPAAPAETAPPQEAVVEDIPEDVPVAEEVQPLETPDPVAPIAETEQPIPVEPSETPPKPRPADRVASEPVDSEDAPDVAEEVIPEVSDTPTEDSVIVEQDQPAAAPQEATTQIITEAVETDEEAPQLAPTTSLRPRSRPETVVQPDEPVPVVAATDPVEDPAETPEEAPAEDPVADAIAAALAEASQEPAVETPPAEPAQGATDAPAGPPMTAGEKDAMRVAVKQCWNVGTLSMEALRTTVIVGLTLSQDGKPDAASITLVDSSGGSDASTQQAFEAARRAIIRCGARGFPLPPEKYDTWKSMELVFDPEGMRMR